MLKQLSIKKLFLIDAIGALVSAFMLGVVLVKFQYLIGMPKNILYILSAIPIAFFINSFRCYKFTTNNLYQNLKVVAVLNLLYCGLTASLLIIHFNSLTFLGVTYFITEIIIVVALSVLELKATLRKAG